MPLKHGRYLCIPANLVGKDFSYLIPGERDIERRAESVFLFLHYLATRTRLRKPEDELEEDQAVKEWGYVQIHSDTRRLILGEDYPKIIQGLITEGIIEPMLYRQSNSIIDDAGAYSVNMEYYKQGKSCKLYKLKELSRENPLVYLPISDKPYLIDKLKRIIATPKFKVDPIEDALKYNSSLLRYRVNEESVAAMQEYLEYTEQTETTAEDEILKMNCGDSGAEIDGFGFRFHAYHTRLKKHLRKYLYFEGYENKPLVEIDFRSSQPFLFANINANIIRELVPECKEAIPIFEKHEQEKHSRKNLKEFRELCQQAKIYTFFQQKFKDDFDLVIDKQQAKEVFCRGFFCNYSKTKASMKNVNRIIRDGFPLYPKDFTALSVWVIRKYFPAIYGINSELKGLNWQNLLPGLKKYKRYANNCLLAQRIESAIILKRISKDLIDKEILFVTIHDSFIIPKNQEWEVKRIIKENFRRLGVKAPKLQVKCLTSKIHLMP